MGIKSVITADDLKAYLGIDYADDMVEKNIEQALTYADGELCASVAENYSSFHHSLIPELALLYASASYEKRALTDNELKRADQIALKLRLYLRRVYQNDY